MAVVALLGRAVVSAVLLLAGFAKLDDLHGFAADVYQFRILPAPLALGLAFYLPFLEIVVAAALWLPPVRAGAHWIAFGLFAVFVAALFSAWIRGLDIRCGCFGPEASSDVFPALLRATALWALTAWLASRSPPRSPQTPPG